MKLLNQKDLGPTHSRINSLENDKKELMKKNLRSSNLSKVLLYSDCQLSLNPQDKSKFDNEIRNIINKLNKI